MKRVVVLSLLFVLVLFTGVTFAQESVVKIPSRGLSITGTLVVPEGVKNPPVVLMLHGFASKRDEVGNFYLNLAKELEKVGIASLRIDFIGSGESEGKFENTTVTGQIDDAKVALKYLKNCKKYTFSKFGVLGFSLGGIVAASLAGEEKIDSLALWSTTGDVVGVFKEELGKYFPIAYNEGSVFIDLGWTKFTLNKAFFESLYNVFPYESITHYMGPLLVIAGEKDKASVEGARNLLYNHPGRLQMKVIIPGVGHIYGVLSKDLGPSKKVIKITKDWFAQTLK